MVDKYDTQVYWLIVATYKAIIIIVFRTCNPFQFLVGTPPILFARFSIMSTAMITQYILFLQDWFINNDIDMYQEESNTPARVRSHNLNVELAKVFIY